VAFLLVGCAGAGGAAPGSAAPVIKLGVIAPFEGAGRPLGYAVLPPVKAVVAEANAGHELGPYRVTVVAFNDSLDPAMAAQQARALALEGDVMAVVGPFSAAAVDAARPILADGGLAHISPASPDPLSSDYADEIAAAEQATRAVLAALAGEIRETGRPSREGVRARLLEIAAP
jgi:ABC-type branched-subunit amino acid transport system substrate-binding protein